ncbi:MAG: hypothetical protein KDB24_04055 [Microthrixaceae bacterium]|nr:hypothetical protein [Microthrixaceae bacterium]
MSDSKRTNDEGDEAAEPGGDPASDLDVGSVDEHVDDLPEDLDLTAVAGPITFPNNNRRRIPALIYLVLGLGAIAVSVIYEGEAVVNGGLAVAGGLLALFGLFGLVAGRTLNVDDQEAFATAGSVVGFPVGHASAQQVWRGWLSTPTWRILIYSAENPPKNRGIVLVDGITGEVVEWFAEENPDQWDADQVDA